MRWGLVVVVVAWSAAASAQAITLPAHFTKRAGGELYKQLAGPSADVHIYGDRDVELATVAWTWKLPTVTRSGLAAFERELARRSMADGAKQVSNTAVFDHDPMFAEVFDLLGALRIYHRRLYAVDAQGTVHLWWTVCTGAATEIGDCEQAQRTMKLGVAHTVTLPAEAPPPPSAKPIPPPPPLASLDPTRPGTIDVPAGYHEQYTTALEEMLDKVRMFGRVDQVEGHLFVAPGDSVRLLQISFRMAAEGDAPHELVRQIDEGLTDGHGAPHVVGANVASEMTSPQLERRTLYAADPGDHVYAFSVACIGPVPARADCVRALDTMRLIVPYQIEPTSAAWDHDSHGSALAQLGRLLLIVVVPLAVVMWVVKNRYRLRARRRTPPPPDAS
ncbi:MAG TPA: hypothetical protein VFQ65_26260 [Kofleriaceae bacterium]|nr:hypothetical protein [Kofleriaceae bacterium]